MLEHNATYQGATCYAKKRFPKPRERLSGKNAQPTSVGQECPTYDGCRMRILARRRASVLGKTAS
jgi:hypothetical protein